MSPVKVSLFTSAAILIAALAYVGINHKPKPTLPATAPATAAIKPVSSNNVPAGASIVTDSRWADLTAAQKKVLAPLAQSWMDMPEVRRKKWVEIANKYHELPEQEQQRMQVRMKEWAQLTPEQRRVARENYKRVKELPKDERQQQWETYKQLSDEERKALAEQAQRAAKLSVVDPSRPTGAAAYTRPNSPAAQPASPALSLPAALSKPAIDPDSNKAVNGNN